MYSRPMFSLAMPVRASRSAGSLQCRRAIRVYRPPFPTSPPKCLAISRYASSSFSSSSSSAAAAASPVPAKSPTSTVPVPQVLAKLNPPDDTYAPELTIPAKKPGQNSFRYLWQCGKLYAAFYKKGIKNVTSTAKVARKLRAKAASSVGDGGGGLGVLTRAEWQIVRRSRRDILRLPGFAVLVLVFGEWMPLIALYITGLVPEACRIPRQVERTLRKLEARRKERERRLALDAARLVSRDRKPGSTSSAIVRPAGIRPQDVDKLDLYTLLRLSTKLDAHSQAWDWLFTTPPKPLLKWGVRRKLDYLARDDGLIGRDGGAQALNEKEVGRACVERGLDVVGKSERELRKGLAEWFKR